MNDNNKLAALYLVTVIAFGFMWGPYVTIWYILVTGALAALGLFLQPPTDPRASRAQARHMPTQEPTASPQALAALTTQINRFGK